MEHRVLVETPLNMTKCCKNHRGHMILHIDTLCTETEKQATNFYNTFSCLQNSGSSVARIL